ncbi:MAG: hypothetical protein LQ345_005274 [Seirophora villosa]|nr:MAG: hypothetical protein LQ345_005274 [Seirophora villosa]
MSSSSSSTPQQSPIFYVPQLCPAPNSNSKAACSFSTDQLPYPYSPSDCYVHSNPSTPSYDCLYLDDSAEGQYMTSDSSYNPSICIEHLPPDRAFDYPFTSPPSMLEGNISSWDSYRRPAHLSPHALQHHSINRAHRGHKRISSDSSVASVGPDSPYTQTLATPHIVDLDSTSVALTGLDSYDSGFPLSAQYSKSHSAPQTSQKHDSFLAAPFQDYNTAAADPHAYQAVQTAMRQTWMEQQRASGINHQSHSSRGSFDGEYNELTRIASAGRNNTAKLNRTMSDIYQDELYNPSIMTTCAPPAPAQQYIPQENFLSPQKNTVFNDLLQAAQNGHVTAARSASPATSMARERSPFVPGSPCYPADKFPHSAPNSPARLGSAARMREQQKAESDAMAFAKAAKHQHRPEDFAPPTVSPKDVALDYNEAEDDAKMPLFKQDKRENQLSTFASSTPNLSQSDVDDTTSERSYRNMGSRRQRGSNLTASTASGQSGSNITFMPPAVPGNVQMPHTYPFMAQMRRQSSSLRSTTDQPHEFPTLTSMESSKSETTQSENPIRPEFPSSAESTQRSPSSPGIPRPSDTAAATGSYTCTSPNCTARFETSAKLQKHRREAHRSSPPRPTVAAPTTSSTTTTPSTATTPSSSSAPVSRNQQAGPHKCERINPSTGKPCNTIFSRSYDLTRHEDTIHNNRKQKVRCHLCTEEKTFSRNDALTRHMRVVHPEVDFPGKTKRRGG